MLQQHFGFRILPAFLACLLAFLVWILIVSSSHAEEVTSGTTIGTRTQISSVSWDPSIIADDNKVVYGPDDRRDVYEETDTKRLEWATSVCALVNASDLKENGNGTFTLSTKAYRQNGYPPCSGEAFSNQPTAAWCTGFVVSGNLIATAGHCIETSDLPYVRFLFGFEMVDATTPVLVFDADQVYTGVEIIGRELTSTYDYAVVRVDRTVSGVDPLPLRRSGTIAVGTQVGVIGHPSGLPKKIAFGVTTKVSKNESPGFFCANLDTYGGNSGSPVFNASDGVVEGILVRGNNDFVFTSGCFRSEVLPDTGLDSEEVSKSDTFVNYVTQSSGADDCGDAVVIELNETKTGSTDSATGTDISTCGIGDSKDVWFFFRPTLARYYELSLAGSDFNTTLAVYRDGCTGLVEVGCNDDALGLQSELCLHLDASISYLVRIAGYGGTTGFYSLNIAQIYSCGPAEGEGEGEGEGESMPPGVTITACHITPSPVNPGQMLTLSDLGGKYKSGVVGETVKVTVGLRTGSGVWVGGVPVVVESGNPGTVPATWTGSTGISAPLTVGTYYVWVRCTVTDDDAVAIQDFKNAVPVSADRERNDKWGTQILVRVSAAEGEEVFEGEPEGEMAEGEPEGEGDEGETEEGEPEPACCGQAESVKGLFGPEDVNQWLGDLLVLGSALMVLSAMAAGSRRD